jgi:ubiquitin-protein ligase
VNNYGRVCHSIFTRNWSADTSMAKILDTIYGLLLTPDKSDPLDSIQALRAYDDSGEYEATILQSVERHAKKTRAEWRKELLGTSATSD